MKIRLLYLLACILWVAPVFVLGVSIMAAAIPLGIIWVITGKGYLIPYANWVGQHALFYPFDIIDEYYDVN